MRLMRKPIWKISDWIPQSHPLGEMAKEVSDDIVINIEMESRIEGLDTKKNIKTVTVIDIKIAIENDMLVARY